MACPYRSNVNNNDGSAYCDLCQSKVDNITQQTYCISHSNSTYESCPKIVEAELLTESVCEEIISSFEDAVNGICEGIAGFVETVTFLAVQSDYVPLYDACLELEVSPDIPQLSGDYVSLVKTAPEIDLAKNLESELNRILDLLRFSVSCGCGDGANLSVSPDEIRAASAKADEYGEIAANYIENFSVSVKPDKYARPIQNVASNTGVALRHHLFKVVDSFNEAAQTLEEGMSQAENAAKGLSGYILGDAGISWLVD